MHSNVENLIVYKVKQDGFFLVCLYLSLEYTFRLASAHSVASV